MTEQDWQKLKEILSAGTPTQWQLFNKVLEMQQENERLRSALELIIKNTVSGHVEQIARRALEGKE